MYHLQLNQPKRVFFIGIGGISMSGLAMVLAHHKFIVSGSDVRESDTTHQLESNGITVFIPQDGAGLDASIDIVVYTAAVHDDNPEILKAKELQIPLLTRAQLLGEIMENFKQSIAIAGTHGKTTTTSMLAQILLTCESDPTISVGGILPIIHSNIKIGNSDIFVTEACEYTNSFFSFYPKYSVILNVDADHLDFFSDLNEIYQSFHQFAKNTKSDGALFINGEIPRLNEVTDGLPCRIITFGLSEHNHCYAKDIIYHNGCASFIPVFMGEEQHRMQLQIPGEHNILNTLASISVALEMKIPFSFIEKSFLSFFGANRRFQKKGTFKNCTVIDDYAHHPTEIAATLQAAKKFESGKVTLIFQPHTYTRTKALFDSFIESLSLADTIYLLDIYAARETDTLGIHSKDIEKSLQERGKEAVYFSSFDQLTHHLKNNFSSDGLLITMGAGNVYLIGEALVQQ